MKTLLIADIHSNICALEAIWKKEQDSEFIYCAGDLVDWGPFPKQVLNWVREHRVICVRGNHDEDVVSCYRQCGCIEDLETAELLWKHHNAMSLDEQDISFLDQLPTSADFSLDGVRYCMSHSYPINIKTGGGYGAIETHSEFISFVHQNFPMNSTESLPRLIFGHTHRLGVHYLSDVTLWINPGSISYRRPDDQEQGAHYITITDSRIRLRRVEYDLEPLFSEVRHLKMEKSQLNWAYWAFRPR